MPSTVTLSRRRIPSSPLTTTDSRLFLDKTNMAMPHSLGQTLGFRLAPSVGWHTVGDQNHLRHGSGPEDLHDSARRRFDFRGRLAHIDAGDSFDFLPERIGVVGEQLPMKVLHLSGAGRTLGQSLLGR